MDKKIMNKNKFLELLNFYQNPENIGKRFWRIAQFYCSNGYLDACTVYRITADVFNDGSEDDDIAQSWINIYEMNSDIIIRILEDEIDLDDSHREWIKDGLDNSYYRKMYYFLHYTETTPGRRDIEHSFLLDDVFTELNDAISFALSRIRDYGGYNSTVTYDTNEKALEFLDIFNEDLWIDDTYIYINLEILALYKKKNGSEILKTVREMKKIEEFVYKLEDDEYRLSNKKKNLDNLLSEIDKKQKMLQDIIDEFEQKKESILSEKFILEREFDSVKQNILDIETQKKDLLNNIKLLEW